MTGQLYERGQNVAMTEIKRAAYPAPAREEAIAAIRVAHEWLEAHDRLNRGPDGRRIGLIGLDHALGENEDGCSLCHAVAALEGRVYAVDPDD